MRHIFAFLILASALSFTSCGKSAVPAQASTGASTGDEECDGCTEKTLNRAVGPQPAPEPEYVYDLPANPSRTTLRFPQFDARWGLTKRIYDEASAYFEAHKATIQNPRYFTVIDFNLSASKKRLFLFDLSNGSVEKHAVAAGKNSDPGNTGYATHFSNSDGSEESSLGFYQTLATYNGTHGLSLRLKGVSATDSNVENRDIVMHPAKYVDDTVPHAGRSWGCTAIDPKISASVIGRLKNGSMMLVDR